MNQGVRRCRTSEEAGWKGGFFCCELSRPADTVTMFNTIHNPCTGLTKEKAVLN
jgi:hypothetical protein